MADFFPQTIAQIYLTYKKKGWLLQGHPLSLEILMLLFFTKIACVHKY